MQTLLPFTLLLAVTSLATAQTSALTPPGGPAGEVRVLERVPHHRVLGWTVAEPTPFGESRLIERKVVQRVCMKAFKLIGQTIQAVWAPTG